MWNVNCKSSSLTMWNCVDQKNEGYNDKPSQRHLEDIIWRRHLWTQFFWFFSNLTNIFVFEIFLEFKYPFALQDDHARSSGQLNKVSKVVEISWKCRGMEMTPCQLNFDMPNWKKLVEETRGIKCFNEKFKTESQLISWKWKPFPCQSPMHH